MNYLRKFRNRYVSKIELVSALENESFLISPPDGFSEDPLEAQYHGIYFTISSVSLVQNSKSTSSGILYTKGLSFSFPTFPGSGSFMVIFSKLSEIKLTMNTGTVIRLNKNDISLNKPIDVEFKANLKIIEFEAQFTGIMPFDFNE